jgi:hypothetical protein
MPVFGGPVEQDLPEPMASTQKRHCPNMRSCYPVKAMFESFSLVHTPGWTTLARRIGMYVILILRTISSLFWLLRGVPVVSFIIGIILTVLSFFFVAYCLHLIDRRCVQGGSVRCFGLWSSPHFNMFVAIIALIHFGIFFGFLVGLPWVVSSVLWLVMWLLIFAVGWVASWAPEPESRSAGVV